MIETTSWRQVAMCCGLGAMLASTAGCHGLLSVTDPTHLSEQAIASASGANAKRLNASSAFVGAMPSVAVDVAVLTDEWTYDAPAGPSAAVDRFAGLDQRSGALMQLREGDFHLGNLDGVFTKAGIAIPAVRAYTSDSLRGDFLAQLYAIRGYAALQMAEDLCPGFPINDVIDDRAVYGDALTTDSVMAIASAQLDSALKYVRDSTRFVTLARVTKGRLLLDQQKYAEAAAMVAPVATADVYTTETQTLSMALGTCSVCATIAIVDHEGRNGLPFVAAHDPRLPTQFLGMRHAHPIDSLYATTKGQTSTDLMILASGVEARLIQAEASLHIPGDWTAILDSLRATVGVNAVTDPGTLDARVDTLYSERAFWLFMTGRRLGDMRRLLKNYERDPETVFPTGSYLGGAGGTYGTATSIAFSPLDQQRYNPRITIGCTAEQ